MTWRGHTALSVERSTQGAWLCQLAGIAPHSDVGGLLVGGGGGGPIRFLLLYQVNAAESSFAAGCVATVAGGEGVFITDHADVFL